LLADDWPQWRGPARDGVWRETGIVSRFDAAELKPLWRTPVGSGFCGPTVAAGRVYLMDRASSPVARERILCFDASTGQPLWTNAYACEYHDVAYASGPRASVTVENGRAYALGTMGNLSCVDAATGHPLWTKSLEADYSGRPPQWGLAAAPLIEGDLVIAELGAPGACLVAFDKRSGLEKWKALSDRPAYSAPIVVEHSGKRVVVCVTGERVVGLDPLTGQVVWEQPFPPSHMPITTATPVLQGDCLFVTSVFDGALMLKLQRDKPAVELAWRRNGKSERDSDALQCVISTPLAQGDCLYGIDSYGQFRCLDMRTGDRLWENKTVTPQLHFSTVHFVRHGQEAWLFNELGELIIARLTPQSCQEISRARLIEPTTAQPPRPKGVCWAHPAFANRCVYARNDLELLCVDLALKTSPSLRP
jgi:outer membrane protein assembly factor BamB